MKTYLAIESIQSCVNCCTKEVNSVSKLPLEGFGSKYIECSNCNIQVVLHTAKPCSMFEYNLYVQELSEEVRKISNESSNLRREADRLLEYKQEFKCEHFDHDLISVREKLKVVHEQYAVLSKKLLLAKNLI